MFRFRLIELLMAVVVFSLAALALAKPSLLAVSIVSTVVYLVLLGATVVALAGTGPRRVFCLGFVVGGMSYLALLHFMIGGESGDYPAPRLLTTRALALLYPTTTHATNPYVLPQPSSVQTSHVPTYGTPTLAEEPSPDVPASADELSPMPIDDSNSSESTDLTPAPALTPVPQSTIPASSPPPAVDASTSSFGWQPYPSGTSYAPSPIYMGDSRRIAFFDIGQQFWALAIGMFAGCAARLIYARSRPQDAAA